MKHSTLMMASMLSGIAGLTACNQADTAKPASNPQASTTATTTQTTAANKGKVYTVTMDAEYPPFDFRAEDGSATGMDVDILQAVANNQGFQVNIVPMPGDTVIPQVADGSYDIGIGGIAPSDIESEGLSDKVNKSYAYSYSIDTIASISPVIDTYQGLKGHKVATLAESGYISDLKTLYGVDFANHVTESKTIFLAYQQLLMGKTEAVLGDKAVLSYYNKKYADKTQGKIQDNASGYYFENYYPMTFISKKSDPELAEKINKGIEAIVKDGTYAKIHQKWLGIAPAIIPKPEPIPAGDAALVSASTAIPTKTP